MLVVTSLIIVILYLVYLSRRRLTNHYNQVTLSNEQRALFNKIETTQANLFVTGKAGTGKSLLIKYLCKHTSKRCVVVAPTGISAININGQTIHSFFKISPDGKIKAVNKNRELIRHLNLLIIDEVSMVRADLMDAIDLSLRYYKNSKQPFGGVQVILVGDLYQLAPVLDNDKMYKYFRDNYGGHYFFKAKVWRKTKLKIYELSKVYRQQEGKFLDVLNEIRIGKFNHASISLLNSRVCEVTAKNIVTIAATNKQAKRINMQYISKLKTKVYSYKAKLSGKVSSKDFLVDTELKLKVGAQVMLLRNDKYGRWVNGSIGVVKSLGKSDVKVKVGDKTYNVKKQTWVKYIWAYNKRNSKVITEPIGFIKQYPLKLAWAITVHKSQGQTYNECIVDLRNGVFTHSQAYVALSRCKNLSGLYLTAPILASDISVDPSIGLFIESADRLVLDY